MSLYFDITYLEVPRLLSLQDRNPVSPTYGCFHRCFWLHRLSDFPSSIRQQAILPLARFYCYRSKDNRYFESDALLEYIKAGIDYLIKLQNKDGSFDEWYPGEHGWAGPTGYLTYALSETYSLIKEKLLPAMRKEVESCLLRASWYLAKGWERHVLFNHVAMALLPIYLVADQLNDAALKDHFFLLWKKSLGYFDFEEGWGIEYDGADIGYQSATLSFLSRLHKKFNNSEVEEICKKSINFISYFAFPDGSFARKLGSRQTDLLFHYGVEYWSESDELAASLQEWSRQALKGRKQLWPSEHEDHYFIYRMVEFCDCLDFEEEKSSEEKLPYLKSNFSQHFKNAGIFIKKKDELYFVLNWKRGGAAISFSGSELSGNDKGFVFSSKDGTSYTSFMPQERPSFSELDDMSYLIKGSAKSFKQPVFSTWTMILFRIASKVLASHKLGAYWLKAFIRKILLNLSKDKAVGFEREISFSEGGLKILNKIDLHSEKIEALYEFGDFDIRFVPQSRYFKLDELDFSLKKTK